MPGSFTINGTQDSTEVFLPDILLLVFSEIATLAPFSTWMEAMKLFSVFVLKEIDECVCVHAKR